MSTEIEFKGAVCRTITLYPDGALGDPVLQLKDTVDGKTINAAIRKEVCADLGKSLIDLSGKDGIYVTDLPKAHRATQHILADNTVKMLDDGDTSDDVLRKAKALLSIYKSMVTIDIENEAKEKAEAERQKKIDAANALMKRRNELARKFDKNIFSKYNDLEDAAQEAIDYIIEQEDAK